MTTYGVYTLSNGQYHWNLFTIHYHNCLNRVNDITKSGKDCIIVSGEPKDLHHTITGEEENLNIEAIFLGALHGH